MGAITKGLLTRSPTGTKGVGLTFGKGDFNRFIISNYRFHILFLYLVHMHLSAKKRLPEQSLGDH
jgi:hypothetical protein